MKAELQIKDDQFVSKLDATYVKLVHWIVQMNSDVMQDAKIEDKDQAIQTEFLKQRANLIIQGLDLATELKRNVKTLILMY